MTDLVNLPARTRKISCTTNVYAQGGQFTLVLQPAVLDLDRPADRSPQTPVLRKMAALHNITLPIAEAPRLLRLLALENTNGASLFPAYD